MFWGLRRRSGIVQAFAALALLAVLVRAIAPAGYMLAPAQDGRFITVTLCSGHGSIEALVDRETGLVVDAEAAKKSSPPSAPSAADAPCVFAAAAPLAPAEAATTISVSFRAVVAERAHDLALAPGRGLAAPPPWSTGPPLTA